MVVSENAASIQAVIEREASVLQGSIALRIARLGGSRRPDEVADLAAEVLGETVCRALESAARYDPRRSAVPWLLGIAHRVLLDRRRKWAREHRNRAGSSEVDGAFWVALDQLAGPSGELEAGDRLAVRDVLDGLDSAARHVLECRFYRGLDGDDLARELGAPSAGAARVRVSRALQRFRDRWHSTDGSEIKP
jgi:RNA polymerase sigma factor (sigma-70 family)